MSVAAVEPVPGAVTGGDPTSEDAADAPDDTETEEAVEGAEPAAADGGEQADDGTEKPDIEPAPELPAASAELDEETLRSAAFKFANKTMAAVRRAEKRVETVKTENTTLKGHLQTYAGFVERLQKGDPTALREIGFGTVREFLDAVTNFGEVKPPTAETRLEALERQLKEREEAAAKSGHEAAVAESQRLVFAHVDSDKSRWKYTATAIGHEQLWDALGEYYAIHGDAPDAVVPIIADAVEKHLRAQFGETSSGQRQPAKNGASAPPPAAGGARNSGKTLTNRGSSGAPAPKVYSDNDDERRKQIAEELRAEGLLG